jgi:hypothetical protein
VIRSRPPVRTFPLYTDLPAKGTSYSGHGEEERHAQPALMTTIPLGDAERHISPAKTKP